MKNTPRAELINLLERLDKELEIEEAVFLNDHPVLDQLLYFVPEERRPKDMEDLKMRNKANIKALLDKIDGLSLVAPKRIINVDKPTQEDIWTHS